MVEVVHNAVLLCSGRLRGRDVTKRKGPVRHRRGPVWCWRFLLTARDQRMTHRGWLWVRSGHWDKFGEHMFAMNGDGRSMALKPMSCPCHVQIFNKGVRSWLDLPIRYAEFGACHRDEPSGALHGLMRTRAFEQDDAHVFCREEDVEGEVARFIGLLSDVYRALGFAEHEVALSTRPAARAGSDELWDWAEQALGDAAHRAGVSYHVQPGEGAFYGPKLEFALRDRLGRSWQCGTVQLDCVIPGRLGCASAGSRGGTRDTCQFAYHGGATG
jgi:threonyl-tRNA synthetase